MSLLQPLRDRRRRLIDAVYGAEEDRGANIYLASIWGIGLLACLIFAGFTPWNWPAEREGRVESLAPVSCEAILGEDDEEQAAARNQSATKARPKAGARNSCRQLLSEAERSQLGRVEATVAYLQRGGPAPAALALPEDGVLRGWVNSNICRLGGADGADRGALAWHVGQGIGECGGWAKQAAGFPLSTGLGWWAGMLLTPLLILILLFFLTRHSLRLPATRREYRRLFGSEHKAP